MGAFVASAFEGRVRADVKAASREVRRWSASPRRFCSPVLWFSPRRPLLSPAPSRPPMVATAPVRAANAPDWRTSDPLPVNHRRSKLGSPEKRSEKDRGIQPRSFPLRPVSPTSVSRAGSRQGFLSPVNPGVRQVSVDSPHGVDLLFRLFTRSVSLGKLVSDVKATSQEVRR